MVASTEIIQTNIDVPIFATVKEEDSIISLLKEPSGKNTHHDEDCQGSGIKLKQRLFRQRYGKQQRSF
jgi:hypothetical protein